MNMGDITIAVSKETLLEKLHQNRAGHREVYDKAWEGYKKLMRRELENRLELIKANMPIDPFLRHQAPDDHTGDYDDVIDMLDMALGNEVELTQAQFKCYVKDDWGWKGNWTASTTAYLEAR